MLLDIEELRERDKPLLLEVDFSEQDLKIQNQVSALNRPVHSTLKVTLRSSDQVQVAGSLRAEVQFTCCRCLKPFPRTLEKGFDLEYWPQRVVSREGEEWELTYPELVIGFYREQRLDLAAVISEQVLLEIPMKPVCRENCKGLCVQCGADLNERSCGCEPRAIDPRLGALAELKKRMAP